ncbi:MAG: D,D-heptose 1,7-bisphosphate phosphatase [Halieaceae bacterium]|nr:D,D-heptose 1,7-bisphosphate phosphatase [Halieaceae bacterium]
MAPAAFLDRDGVINVDHGYVSRWEDFEFLPHVPEALLMLQKAGYQLIVISNQSGIGRGFYTEQDVEDLNQCIAHHLKKQLGIKITGFYHCPHHPTDALGDYLVKCECRKPAPGMILHAAQEHSIDLADSLLVGDKASDIEAGKAAGVGRLFYVSSRTDVDRSVDCFPVTSLRDVADRL